MMIGEVFGQPNELFKNPEEKTKEKDTGPGEPTDMQESLQSQDDTTIGDGIDEQAGASKDDAMLDLEENGGAEWKESKEANLDTSALRTFF
jgi:hypothetical protein